MVADVPGLPYEKQETALSSRMCGAAALCMVYRSFGLACSQAAVWPTIATPRGEIAPCARTYLLCGDALRRGFDALTLQVRQPLRFLQLAMDWNGRVILNHRLRLNSPAGHYSVLVDFDEVSVTLHDPFFGPARRLALAEWLKLWCAGRGDCEVRGNVAVVISRRSPESAHCCVCARCVPQTASCPACRAAISLKPARFLGCLSSDCPERTWEMMFCPWCDAVLPVLE